MKERPILFSAPMVRAILAGTKTQTRRIVKPAGLGELLSETKLGSGIFDEREFRREECIVRRNVCPYGQPGDRLWVKETWFTAENLDGAKPTDLCDDVRINYAADLAPDSVILGRLRPSIFMRRWMSRITLELVSVRVERLQDISEADAEAEGVERNTGFDPWKPEDGWLKYPLDSHLEDFPAFTAKESYRTLWESINGAGSWDENPWVWAIEFRRVQP